MGITLTITAILLISEMTGLLSLVAVVIVSQLTLPKGDTIIKSGDLLVIMVNEDAVPIMIESLTEMLATI